MKKVIIGIHGLSNKPEAKILSDWWIDSIREGLNRIGSDIDKIPFELVYWADILYDKPLDPDIKNVDDPLFLDEPYAPTEGDPKKELSVIRTRIMKYIEEELDSVFLNEDMSLNFEDVTDKIVHLYFGDLEKYYSNNEYDLKHPDMLVRESIRKRLRDTLKKYEGWDILLIAHSMGTIIAFDELMELEDEFEIHTLLTIGSPLGLPIIVSRIYEEMRRRNKSISTLHVPNSIRNAWYNMSDIFDTVALDHTLKDDYKASVRGISVEDYNVYNDYEMEGKRNPHKSFGYLRTEELSHVVNEFLSPFGLKNILWKWEVFMDQIKTRIVKLFQR